MLKKPIYENENHVELYALYASETDHGKRMCPYCQSADTETVAEAIREGYDIPDDNSLTKWFCKHCEKIF